jgi:hypothetical protein
MRRPPGYTNTLAKTRELGEYFARLAELEEASSQAFHLLSAELTEHGAPAALVRATKRASREEARHVELVSGLARKHGATVTLPTIERAPPRDLEALAIDNAMEGCVRETYLSLVAARQAETAEDLTIRAALKSIARDESEHAALSWTLAGWLEPRMRGEARRRYSHGARIAIQALRSEAYAPYAEALRRITGLPSVRDALALIDSLDRTMWQKLDLLSARPK